MGISNCPGELPWPGVTGTSRVLQNHPSITHRSCATKPSQQGLTLTPLCSWVPQHSDTQESKLQHSLWHQSSISVLIPELWLQQIRAHEGTMQQGSIRD